jgi:transposase
MSVALKISKSVVGKYVSLSRVAGVACAAVDGQSNDALEARLYRPALARCSLQLVPDFGVAHQELKRPGVTLMPLWEEYASANPATYKHTSCCIKYREFAKLSSARCARRMLPTRSCSSMTPVTRCPSSMPRRARSPRRSGEECFSSLAGRLDLTWPAI